MRKNHRPVYSIEQQTMEVVLPVRADGNGVSKSPPKKHKWQRQIPMALQGETIQCGM